MKSERGMTMANDPTLLSASALALSVSATFTALMQHLIVSER